MLHLFKPIDLQWLLVEAYGPVDFAKSIHTYIYIFNDIFFLRAAASMFLLNRIAGPEILLFRLRLKQWHTTPVLLCSVGLQSVPWLFLHIIKVSVWILRKGKLQNFPSGSKVWWNLCFLLIVFWPTLMATSCNYIHLSPQGSNHLRMVINVA